MKTITENDLMDLIDKDVDSAHYYGATYPDMFDPFYFIVSVDFTLYKSAEEDYLKILYWAQEKGYVTFIKKEFLVSDRIHYQFALTNKGFDLYKIRLL